MYTSTLSSLVLGFEGLSHLPHAFFKSALLNLSDVAFSIMFNDMPSVDITRSLYPRLFAVLAASFSFFTFLVSSSSYDDISRSSFSSGGVFVPSIISSYPLLSAMTLNFRANSCQLSLVLSNLYTFILFRSSLFTHTVILLFFSLW